MSTSRATWPRPSRSSSGPAYALAQHAGGLAGRRWPEDHLASLIVNPLPPWLVPLPDAETMHVLDRWAIEERGVAGLDLMERAGAGVARAVERLAPDGPVTVVCGK